MRVTADDVRRSIRELQLTDSAVCLHTSMRSFGRPTPRADDVIDAFLDEGCTLLVPTGSHGVFGISPPIDMRPERNGTDYTSAPWSPPHNRIFDTSSDLLDDGFGVLPARVLARDGRIRGDHPLSSFTGLGPRAAELVGGQSPDDPAAPLARLAATGGFVLLIGVGLTRMTLIHLAEQRAGRERFRRWAYGPDGTPRMVKAGSCSEGFERMAPALAPAEVRIAVGSSIWRSFDAARTLALATDAIVADPHITHCGTDCERCDDMVFGGPIV
jgi:aminoglycoside N3'-acetyltransferase